MKIKRFEAPTMSEALRLIKKEFGDEAVILSAKSQKKTRRLIGKKDLSQVVVTAAIDKQPEATSAHAGSRNIGKLPALSANDDSANELNASTANSIFKRFKPITKTGRKILKPKIVGLMEKTKPAEAQSTLLQKLLDGGVTHELATEWNRQVQDLLPAEDSLSSNSAVQALSQALQAKRIVGTHHRHQPMQQKCIIMFGPSGAGKTSAAAKMAAKLALQRPDSVAILSLDNQRVAGTAELERFSTIIGVPFKKACKADEVIAVLSQWQDFSHIIVDTPAVSLEDPLQRERLSRQLDLFDSPEHIMVINAAIQERTMSRMIQYFKPLEIHSLCFTGLDWCVDIGALINQADIRKVPVGFISDSPKISEELKTASTEILAQLLLGYEASATAMDDASVTVITRSKIPHDRYYVANRNSDIFHFHECKSVKRINTGNMIVFKDSTEAMGQQFKPCRMCCSELIVKQPFNRPARGYAGSRC